MVLPRFLMGDNADYPEDIFVIHTEYPRFIINLKDDSIEFLEEITTEDREQLEEETGNLIEEASLFYDEQIKQYEE
ncbi:MAG: hypothetical protein WBA16_09595 [Nonlabens sp.]